MKPSLYLVLGFILLSAPLKAEDWTTIEGKVFQNVTVLKVEPDAVTILYRDGGALVFLEDLSADLQKRFNFDPLKAQTAREARASKDDASAKALQEEKAKALAQQRQEIAVLSRPLATSQLGGGVTFALYENNDTRTHYYDIRDQQPHP